MMSTKGGVIASLTELEKAIGSKDSKKRISGTELCRPMCTTNLYRFHLKVNLYSHIKNIHDPGFKLAENTKNADCKETDD